MRWSPIRMGPKSKASPFGRRGETGRREGATWPQATGRPEPRKLEEAGKILLEPPDRAGHPCPARASL